jgi:tetratricopeptide (TPR) repeat protein
MDFDYAQADEELARAVGLAPGNSRVLATYGLYAVVMGHPDTGLSAIRRAVALDPLNRDSHYRLGQALYFARRYAESAVAWSDVLALDPQTPDAHGARGIAYYALGDLQAARASCEARLDHYLSEQCLALVYNRIARQADAEAALAKLKADRHGRAYRPAEIYAQWGNTPQALELLETALRLRDQDLRWLKADPLMDPLRKEPRFQAIERELKFSH